MDSMNLLSLIVILLAVVICAAIAFIAWELTNDAGERERRRAAGERQDDEDATKRQRK